MARLEYRLLDDEAEYPVLYEYDRIDKKEIALRFACEYFVKDKRVYALASCATEPDAYVIYVTEADDEKAGVEAKGTSHWNGVRLEIRQFGEEWMNYPLLHTRDFADMHDVLLYLQSDYVTIGDKEWGRSSTEVDEDRKLYVLYVKEDEDHD